MKIIVEGTKKEVEFVKGNETDLKCNITDCREQCMGGGMDYCAEHKAHEFIYIEKRWRAKAGESYFTIGIALGEPFVEKDIDNRRNMDNKRWDAGNYYQTIQAAKEEAEQVKKVFTNKLPQERPVTE